MIEVSRTALEGVLLIRPKVFSDPRGYFMEAFNAHAFAQATGINAPFVQDNESRSRKGVLRGLHLQAAPHAQAKLVRVVKGAVLDVCVDCRPGSASFGKHITIGLDDERPELLYIPAGMAHGFVALKDDTIFTYKCSSYYHPAAERTILWNDPDLNIDWGITRPIVSEKDQAGSLFAQKPWER